jgi:proteasome component ECM29
VEQHAEAAGIDAGRLESARVAASRSSPMADTLDIASRIADSASLAALAPVLAQLAQRGTGVNTRVGTARFIASLAGRLGSTLRPHAPLLTKARTLTS